MFKQPKNKTACIPVKVTYEDVNKIVYEVDATVIINSSYEIEKTNLICFQAVNENDERIEAEITPLLLEQIETMAGAKALEKIESIDFEKESEEL